MFSLYKNNISDVLGFNAEEFEQFMSYWQECFTHFILKDRSAFIYSEEYFEYILGLFFVILQCDLNLRTKVINPKSVLLVLLTFYLAQDTSLNNQSSTSYTNLRYFYKSLNEAGLISEKTLTESCGILSYFINKEDILSDSTNLKDITLVLDLLISSNPIIASSSHVMFYYDEPTKAKFLVKKPYPKPDDFFDVMFRRIPTITDSLIQNLYSEKLHRLMELQYKKSIFPF